MSTSISSRSHAAARSSRNLAACAAADSPGSSMGCNSWLEAVSTDDLTSSTFVLCLGASALFFLAGWWIWDRASWFCEKISCWFVDGRNGGDGRKSRSYFIWFCSFLAGSGGGGGSCSSDWKTWSTSIACGCLRTCFASFWRFLPAVLTSAAFLVACSILTPSSWACCCRSRCNFSRSSCLFSLSSAVDSSFSALSSCILTIPWRLWRACCTLSAGRFTLVVLRSERQIIAVFFDLLFSSALPAHSYHSVLDLKPPTLIGSKILKLHSANVLGFWNLTPHFSTSTRKHRPWAP